MDLPFEIRTYIENELNKENLELIKKESENISKEYRENKRDGKRLLSKETEAIAYSISRMPATYGAISKAVEKTLEIYNPKIKTVADIGAGTGAAGIAINELIEIKKIDFFEREDAMLKIGKKILSKYAKLEGKSSWNKTDIVKDNIQEKYDLVISSYMINELKEDELDNVINKMWDISDNMIILIEPGTMQGYHNIMRAKEKLIDLGGNIIAPCTSRECKLAKDDWCNFYCRVQRSKIHKNFKSGDSPFEDEKFIYISIAKNKINIENVNRIIRHPLIYNGYMKLKLCKENGIEEVTITKKNKEKFKSAKKLKQGDILYN